MTESKPTESITQELRPKAKPESKSKVSVIIITLLMVVIVVLSAILAVTYNSRYNKGVEAGIEEGVAEGIKLGRSEQIESIKGDRYKGVVGDLVGLNASQAGYLSWAGERRIHINPSDASVPLLFKTPNGESINEDNIQDYKVVAQEPKAYTVFDITYEIYSDGEESGRGLATSGVQEVTVTLEKVEQ